MATIVVDDGQEGVCELFARLQRFPLGMEDGAAAIELAFGASGKSIRFARVAKGNHEWRGWPCVHEQRKAKQERKIRRKEAEKTTEDCRQTKKWPYLLINVLTLPFARFDDSKKKDMNKDQKRQRKHINGGLWRRSWTPGQVTSRLKILSVQL